MPLSRERPRLSRALVGIALTGAVIGSVGAPLITAVATGMRVSLGAAQWTLTVTLFVGAIAAPVLGRLGSGPQRRRTILLTLLLVTVGGVLTVLPLPFAALLVGRGLQGLAVAVVPLLMSVARSHLPSEQSGSALAALSIASTVGIGVGYPVISLIDQLLGLRAAYFFGLALSAAALVVAWRAIPVDPPGDMPRIDVVGSVLLALGTLGVLVVVADPVLWSRPAILGCVVTLAAAAFAAWVVVELRTPARPSSISGCCGLGTSCARIWRSYWPGLGCTCCSACSPGSSRRRVPLATAFPSRGLPRAQH